MKATVFVGGGRITRALIAGLRLARYRTPIVVHDRNPHKLRELQRQYGVFAEPDLARAVAHAGLLIIAVRPDSVANVLEETRQAAFLPVGAGKAKASTIACSLAAGIPLAKLRAKLGPQVGWARAMPSPVGRTGRGLTAVVFEPGLRVAARKQVKEFFANLGQVLEIPESQFDVFTATYSSSHGYHALTVLAKAAQNLGLDRKTALAAAAHALADGIVSWREGNASLDALLQEAATPGGIAATVMKTIGGAGPLKLVERGLRAGVARARKNARR